MMTTREYDKKLWWKLRNVMVLLVLAFALSTISATASRFDPCPPDFCGKTCGDECYMAYIEEEDYCHQVAGCTFVDTCSLGGGTYAECSCPICS
jgi:hypothetical protein